MADRERQNIAYRTVLDATSTPVDWASGVWDEVVARLGDADNHNRSIAAQVLANLAVSAPDRILRDFASLAAVTRDERFVTARHSLQALWKIGTISDRHRDLLLRFLTGRYRECQSEKNATLIRADIIEALAKMNAAQPHDLIKDTAVELIADEPDAKYRKKYTSIWRQSAGSAKQRVKTPTVS